MLKQTVAFSRNSSNLFFHVLTRCNLSCAHCYINREQHGETTLTLDTIRAWLTIFAREADQTNLILLGGEPTLHPDLSSVIKIARDMAFKSITIDTNGYLFHDILDRVTPAELDVISFSLDGATRQTNDAIRGSGSFDAVMTGLGRAVQKGFSCSMIYTVSDQNIHELEKMPDLVRDLGLTRFFIQVVGMRGDAVSHAGSHPADGHAPMSQVTKDTWLTTIPRVAEKIAGHGIIVAYPKVFLGPGEEFQCAANVAKNYFVFPNGRVYQCPVCEDFPLHSFIIEENRLTPAPRINETDLFSLEIPEGCVMNKMIQPGNLAYDETGRPCHKIACCMLKEEIIP